MSLQALEMFTSMRMFDEAKQWAEEAARTGGVGKGSAAAGGAGGAAAVAELIGRQAEWSEETENYEAAVEMYIKVGGHGCPLCRLACFVLHKCRLLARDRDACRVTMLADSSSKCNKQDARRRTNPLYNAIPPD
jgi:hypothetical protein